MSRDYDKRYYKKHKEELKEKQKEYYYSHLEQAKAYRKQYYEDNKEDCLDYDKKYQQKNKEKIAEYKRKWREKRLSQNTSTPQETKHYCWQWFGKRLKDLTLEERKLYVEKRRELKNHQKR